LAHDVSCVPVSSYWRATVWVRHWCNIRGFSIYHQPANLRNRLVSVFCLLPFTNCLWQLKYCNCPLLYWLGQVSTCMPKSSRQSQLEPCYDTITISCPFLSHIFVLCLIAVPVLLHVVSTAYTYTHLHAAMRAHCMHLCPVSRLAFGAFMLPYSDFLSALCTDTLSPFKS